MTTELTTPMKPYTVILVLPDYIAGTYGQEFYTAHVSAPEPIAAAAAGQEQARAAYAESENPNDFFVAAVFAGHLDPLY